MLEVRLVVTLLCWDAPGYVGGHPYSIHFLVCQEVREGFHLMAGFHLPAPTFLYWLTRSSLLV